MILTAIGVLLVLLGVVTLIFHRAGGVSLAVAGVAVAIVGSLDLATDLLAPVALVLVVAGVLAVRTRPGKVLALVGVVVGIAWALGVGQPVPPGAPPVAGDPVEECRDIAFIGVRGSGEAPDAHDGYGAVVGELRDRVAQAASADRATMGDMPLAYPGLGVTSDDWSLGKDLLTGQSLFLGGAAVGADALAARIEQIHATCAGATRIAVVGYSQGALAAHVGLARTSPAALADVAAVALVADPARAEAQPGGPGDPAPGRGVVWLAPDRSALGAEGVQPTLLPGAWRSWCLADDVVCACRGVVSGLASLLLDLDVHTQGYLDAGVIDSVVAGLVEDLGLTGAPGR